MSDQIDGGYERLQYDTEGQVVGKLLKAPFGQWILLLKPDFILVATNDPDKFKLWDCKRLKVLEFAKNDRRG